jgi:hypothetical protein
MSYLLGVRYLSQRETTYILEYYRNGTGFTKEESQNFYRFVDRAYDQYLAIGSTAALGKALNLGQVITAGPTRCKTISTCGSARKSLSTFSIVPRPLRRS